MDRTAFVDDFYDILSGAQKKFSLRPLSALNRTAKLPDHGVYFFFDELEVRGGRKGFRVVRIGTHAARANSNAKLYGRLKQHKGTNAGLGNHRGSVFRELVG